MQESTTGSKYEQVKGTINPCDSDKDGEEAPSENAASLSEMFSFGDGFDMLLLTIGTMGAIITGGVMPFFSVLMGQIMDGFNGDSGDFTSKINTLCLILALGGCVNFVTGFLQVYCWNKAGERQTQKIRVAYVRSIISQDIAWFDSNNPSTLATKVAVLVNKIRDGMGRKFGDAIQYISQVVLSLVAAFYMSWKVAIVLIVSIPLLGAAGTYMIQTITDAQNQTTAQYSAAGGVATIAISAIRTVTAFNMQPHFLSEYRKHLAEALDTGILKGFNVGLGNGLMFGVYYLIYALGFWWGGKLAADSLSDGCSPDDSSDGCITGGTVLAVFLCITMGAEALGMVAPPLSAIATARGALGTALDIINKENQFDESDSNRSISQSTEPSPPKDLTLQAISFAYPTRPNDFICSNFNLNVPAGQTIALVGASGSGKSTIMNLLLRFYEPNSGAILLDNEDIRGHDIRWWRRQIGYVGQEPVLFPGSIAENISFGLSAAERNSLTKEQLLDRIIAAATLANAHDFISAFPSKYDTDVGPSGASLSGGQKQRIAIARALIKQPAILLLDEATSALDAASERVVQESIDSLAARQKEAESSGKKTTIIIIAHRLSTVRNADKICVMEKGQIVESGTHDELILKQSRYYDLVKLQTMDEPEVSPARKLPSAAFHTVDATTAIDIEAGRDNEERGKVLASSKSMDDDTEMNKDESAQVMKRIRGLLIQHPFLIFLGCLGALIFGGLFPAWGYMIAVSIDMFYTTDSEELRDDAAFNACLYILLAGCAFFSAIAQYYGIMAAGEKIVWQIRNQLFESIMRRPVSYFDEANHGVGELTTMLAEYSHTIHKAFGESLAKQAMAVSTLVVGVILGFTASWKISLVVIATFPLNIAAAAVQMEAWQGQQYDNETEDDKKPADKKKEKVDEAKPQATAVSSNEDVSLENDEVVEKAEEEEEKRIKPGALISSAFTNIRTVHAYSMETWIISMYATETNRKSEEKASRGLKAGLGFGASNASLLATYALLYWYGAHLISIGEITFEELLISMMTLMLGAYGLGQALNDLGDQKQAIKIAKKVFDLIDQSADPKFNAIDAFSKSGVMIQQQYVSNISDAESSKNFESFHGAIELKNVCFRYPTRPTITVCENLNLSIKPGEIVALVGPSGCGKSTIINLLLRFYNPTSGQVLIDGQPIDSYNVRSLRSKIGLVGQEPTLFPGTISENVQFGCIDRDPLQGLDLVNEDNMHSRSACCAFCTTGPSQGDDDIESSPGLAMTASQAKRSINQEDVEDVCKLANAHDFISAFPSKYDTDVGPSGASLSGGQKQRIAIARALIKQPAILLLDEATSALDAASERVVQESIDSLAARQKEAESAGKKTTIIIIAHRLSTVRNADKICVMEKGQIVESGTHDELLDRGGLYKQLWEKQMGIN